MANNCLITKFKGTVNNTNVPYYGSIRVKFGAPDKTTAISFRFTQASGKIIAIEGSFNIVSSDGTVIESGLTSKSITAPGELYFMPAVANTKVAFIGKYDSIDSIGYSSMPAPGTIVGYEPPVIEANDINYSTIVSIWNGNRFSFEGNIDLATLQTSMTHIDIEGKGFNTLKVKASGSYMLPSNLNYFRIEPVDNAADQWNFAELDIMKFANCVNLTQLLATLSDEVTGNLNSLLDALHSNGKTSGTLHVAFGSTKVTYNGEEWNSAKVAEKGWSMDVTFTANGWSSSWDV